MALHGGLPIRDFILTHGLYDEVLGPLIAFRLFGESLASDRLLGLLIAPLAYVAAIVYLWKVFPTPQWRFIGLVAFALYPLLIVPRHIPVFLGLGYLSAWAYDGRPRVLFYAGGIMGVASIFSTLDQAVLLGVTGLLFPALRTAEVSAFRRTGVRTCVSSMWASFIAIARPLYGGLFVGLLPFLCYLVLTGVTFTFVDDILRRMEMERYAFPVASPYKSFPPFSLTTAIWYVVPTFYGALCVFISFRVFRWKDEGWACIWPTLLFGILSFWYAMRQYVYWKLAMVSFPFIVCSVYVLYVAMSQHRNRGVQYEETSGFFGTRLLAVFSLGAMSAVLIASLVRDWTPKQTLPSVIFPILALIIMGLSLYSLKRGQNDRKVNPRWMVVACTLMAVIVSAWFCNDAKPQLVGVLLKKPKLIGDLTHLYTSFRETGGKLNREVPKYVEDEVLTYVRTTSHSGREVVILATGAGVYYFLADSTPPNRFPEIFHAQVDASISDVIAGLVRAKPDILVSCDYDGRMITGWPIRPLLAQFISTYYVDSGKRLNNKMRGAACPFTVLIHQGMAAKDQ
jgi:hypothetical protein